MTLTAYKHISLTENGVPVVGGTGFKVKQLVGVRLEPRRAAVPTSPTEPSVGLLRPRLLRGLRECFINFGFARSEDDFTLSCDVDQVRKRARIKAAINHAQRTPECR